MDLMHDAGTAAPGAGPCSRKRSVSGCCMRRAVPPLAVLRRLRAVPLLGALHRSWQPSSRPMVAAATSSAAQTPRTVPKAPAPPADSSPPTLGAFAGLERLIVLMLNSSRPGGRLDWREVEGSWVLSPPDGVEVEAVAHFVGGAFVGAAPQLTYRLFLEALAGRGVLIVATPVGVSFDLLRSAEELQQRSEAALKALEGEAGRLPIYGVGHSLGALLQLLMSARYGVRRSGNALLAFTNRPAIQVIPLLSPLITPSARMLGPLLVQLQLAATSSPLREPMASVSEVIKGLSPSLVQQVLPLLEQLLPVYMDIAQGRREFTPTPEEVTTLVRRYYGCGRNLLLRFKEDELDETIELAALLQAAAEETPVLATHLDISMRTLPGGHTRPMMQAVVDLPVPLARLASSAVDASGGALGKLSEIAVQMGASNAGVALEEMSRGVAGTAHVFGGRVGGPVTDHIQGLADEVAAWMGVGTVVTRGARALPASAISRADSPAT